MQIKERVLLSLSVVFLVIGLFTFAYYSRKPLCIESELINRFQVQTGKEVETVYNCAFRKKVPINRYFLEKQLQIEDALKKSAVFLSTLDTDPFQASIRVLKDSQKSFIVSGQEIILSQDVFENSDFLIRAIIKAWLESKSKNSKDQFFIDSFTEFLFHLYKNDSISADIKWPKVPLTLQAYCSSDYLVPEHFQYCTALQKNESSLTPTVNGDTWSDLPLRKFIGILLYDSYSELSPKYKIETLQSLKLILASSNVHSRPFLKGDNLKAISEWFADGISEWQTFLVENNLRIWVDHFSEALTRRGAEDFDSPPMFDVLFFSGFSKNDFGENIKNLVEISKKYPKRVLGIVSGDHLRVFPNGTEMTLKSWGSLRASRSVIIRCGWPNVEKIISYRSISSKIVVVESCHPQMPIDFNGYLNYGASSLGLDNPSVQFISFHIPSMELAFARGPLMREKIKVLPALQATSRLRNLIGWKSSVWNSKSNAYKVEANIEAIEWYKLPDGYLPEI